jgi:hypothetical protein
LDRADPNPRHPWITPDPIPSPWVMPEEPLRTWSCAPLAAARQGPGNDFERIGSAVHGCGFMSVSTQTSKSETRPLPLVLTDSDRPPLFPAAPSAMTGGGSPRDRSACACVIVRACVRALACAVASWRDDHWAVPRALRPFRAIQLAA